MRSFWLCGCWIRGLPLYRAPCESFTSNSQSRYHANVPPLSNDTVPPWEELQGTEATPPINASNADMMAVLLDKKQQMDMLKWVDELKVHRNGEKSPAKKNKDITKGKKNDITPVSNTLHCVGVQQGKSNFLYACAREYWVDINLDQSPGVSCGDDMQCVAYEIAHRGCH